MNDRTVPTAGEVLAVCLQEQAADFLRALRRHRTSGTDAGEASDAARRLGFAGDRISRTLQVHRDLTDTEWADQLAAELCRLSGTLAGEHAYSDRLDRLRGALSRLSGPEPAGLMALGAARAGALLERRLTLARTRAHSDCLRALGSSRFHAVADAVAVMASEVPPPRGTADGPADAVLRGCAERLDRRVDEAVRALPLAGAGIPRDVQAATEAEDAGWHRVRQLLQLSRSAQDVLGRVSPSVVRASDGRLAGALQALDRHRDAAEAAADAAAAARTARIAPATAYALGVLHADQRHDVEAARRTFGRMWERPGVPAS